MTWQESRKRRMKRPRRILWTQTKTHRPAISERLNNLPSELTPPSSRIWKIASFVSDISKRWKDGPTCYHLKLWGFKIFIIRHNIRCALLSFQGYRSCCRLWPSCYTACCLLEMWRQGGRNGSRVSGIEGGPLLPSGAGVVVCVVVALVVVV